MYVKGDYKKQFSFDDRKKQSQKILDKYPDRVPVIVELEKRSNWTIEKSKYLFPGNITLSQSLSTFRSKMKIRHDEAMFIFINDRLPNTSDTMDSLYSTHKDPDGMLYMVLCSEKTFG